MLPRGTCPMLFGMICLVLTAGASAQTCREIHEIGSDGCAPSPLAGDPVSVTGVVYVPAGTYNTGSIYIQCGGGSGGMTFFDDDSQGILSEGDEIELSGQVGALGSEIKVVQALYEILSTGHSPMPYNISTGELAGGTDRLGDFMVATGVLSEISHGTNCIYKLDDGSGPVVVFVDGTTGIDTRILDTIVGTEVEVRGATRCFQGAGEISPRRDSDIRTVETFAQRTTWGTLKSRY